MHGWVASNRSVSVICPSPPRIHDWLRSKKTAAVVQRRKSDYIIPLGPARNRQPHGSSLMRTRIKHCSALSPWRYISVDHISAHYEALMSLERALGGVPRKVQSLFPLSKPKPLSSYQALTVPWLCECHNMQCYYIEPYLSSSSMSLLFNLVCMELKTLHQGNKCLTWL